MNWNGFIELLQVLGVVLGIAGAIAFVFAYGKANLANAQLTSLRGDRDDQAARIDRLEDEVNEWKAKWEEERTRRQQVETRVTILQGLVTHDSKINELIEIVTKHDGNVEDRFGDLMKSNNELLTLLGKLVESLESHA